MPKTLAPYLIMPGNAEQAVRFYERALGARIDGLMRWDDMPGADVPAALKGKIMHGCIDIGGHQLNLCDAHPDFGSDPSGLVGGAPDQSIHLLLEFDSADELDARFAALAEGGRVTMPLEDTFWNARYGELIDPFGVHWKLNFQRPQG